MKLLFKKFYYGMKGYTLETKTVGGISNFDMDMMPGGMRRGAMRYNASKLVKVWYNRKTKHEIPFK